MAHLHIYYALNAEEIPNISSNISWATTPLYLVSPSHFFIRKNLFVLILVRTTQITSSFIIHLAKKIRQLSRSSALKPTRRQNRLVKDITAVYLIVIREENGYVEVEGFYDRNPSSYHRALNVVFYRSTVLHWHVQRLHACALHSLL